MNEKRKFGELINQKYNEVVTITKTTQKLAETTWNLPWGFSGIEVPIRWFTDIIKSFKTSDLSIQIYQSGSIIRTFYLKIYEDQ